jgi:transcriptional regulator with XRE-family HTH domain
MALSHKQIRAAELLARGYSQEEAGKAVGASRRTVSRWLQQEDFRNLSYGLVGRASATPQLPQQTSERRRQPSKLIPEDLIEDALSAIQSILIDPEARVCDRIKAASLVGQWVGLGQPAKMVELEALKVLVEARWCPDEALEVLIDASAELEEKMKNVLAKNHEKAGNKKAPLQESEGGTLDVDADEFDEFDEFDDEDE